MQQWEGARSWFVLILVLAASLAPITGSAKQGCQDGKIAITQGTESIRDLGNCIWYLEDARQSLGIAEVMASADQSFTRNSGGTLNFGYTESAYWTRFDLQVTERIGGQDYILELALPLVDEVRLFLVRDGQLIDQRRVGYEGDWAERDLAVPNPTFRLALAAGQTTRVYLRVTNTNTFRLPISLWHPDAYIEKVSVDEAVRGILLGSVLAILAYNLFVAVSVREPLNVYYVLYLVSAVIFIATEQVHVALLFDERPWILNKENLHFTIIMTWFWGLLMARSLLETKERSPDLDKVIRLCLHAIVVTFVLSFFLPYHIAMEWIVLASIGLSLILIVVSYLSWRYYNPAARAYFFAWTFALTGFGLYGLTVMGYLPLNLYTSYAPQLGLTLQIVLFSFALADRIKQVQGEALSWSQRALANLQRYQSLFDNAIEGVFQMSLQRRFVAANPAMARLIGFGTSRELLNRNPDVLDVCFADQRVRRRVIGELEATGRVKGVEARYINHQGEERWATISLHTVYDAGGEPAHLEGTCIDATERHQRQRIEREREQERLEKDLARNSAEAKSQFLANMSHEIRTPLAAIIGYGETLLDPDLTAGEKRSSAETVVRSGRHLLDLVNDILDHSKIDANKLNVDIVPVNLPELLEDIRGLFAPRARAKGLDFNIVCEFPLPEMITTDPTRLRQIIINLCGNALKFTEQGSISLSFRFDRKHQRLVARVVDTGIGIKPEQLARLFDPFAQGSPAITREYGGTGLGLNISRRLAELLGGEIQVTSSHGEGSEFEVSIDTGPVASVHFLRDESELFRHRQQIPAVDAPRLCGRILCAEDNDLNRRLVSLFVGRTGAEVVHVGNGAEALETALKESFDLILMDIQMPVMNGRDATAALREAGVNTPVVALTANVMAEDIADYQRAGCNDHLAKPIDRQRFFQILMRYLRAGAAPGPDDAAQPETRGITGSVLVAEDRKDTRQQVEQTLQALGHKVVTAASGDEAVRSALSGPVRLVLMGRHLPVMDGVEATRLLRQAGFRRPIIAFTAGDARADSQALLAAGCDGVLNTSTGRGQLQDLMQRYLGDDTADPLDEAIGPLAAQFRNGLGARKAAMAAAAADRNREALRTEAHQIKGTAGAMGYPEMTRQAGRLEASLKPPSPDWQRVLAELESLRRTIDQAMPETITGPTHRESEQ